MLLLLFLRGKDCLVSEVFYTLFHIVFPFVTELLTQGTNIFKVKIYWNRVAIKCIFRRDKSYNNEQNFINNSFYYISCIFGTLDKEPSRI